MFNFHTLWHLLLYCRLFVNQSSITENNKHNSPTIIITVSHLVIGGETPSLQSHTWSSAAKHHLYSLVLGRRWRNTIFKASHRVINGEAKSLKVRSWSSVAKHHL
jgi:hypothetical protein